jgi:hypothetical protein
MGDFREALGQQGVIKNPVLLCSSMFSIAILYFAQGLFGQAPVIAHIMGAIMHLLAVIVFLIGLTFYIYAFLRLPATVQEQMFLQEGKVALERHNDSLANTNPKGSRDG